MMVRKLKLLSVTGHDLKGVILSFHATFFGKHLSLTQSIDLGPPVAYCMAHQISAILNFSLAENGPSDFGFSLARLSWGQGLMLALVPDPMARAQRSPFSPGWSHQMRLKIEVFVETAENSNGVGISFHCTTMRRGF
jgi:hypothetical protein